jgi:hypothetical protein
MVSTRKLAENGQQEPAPEVSCFRWGSLDTCRMHQHCRSTRRHESLKSAICAQTNSFQREEQNRSVLIAFF